MATPTARMQMHDEAVRLVRCPTCGATRGSSCLTRSHHIANPPHKARLAAAAERRKDSRP